jgi:hypothetical protein
VEIGFDSDTASSSLYFGVDTSSAVGKAGSIDLSVENPELSEIAAFG